MSEPMETKGEQNEIANDSGCVNSRVVRLAPGSCTTTACHSGSVQRLVLRLLRSQGSPGRRQGLLPRQGWRIRLLQAQRWQRDGLLQRPCEGRSSGHELLPGQGWEDVRQRRKELLPRERRQVLLRQRRDGVQHQRWKARLRSCSKQVCRLRPQLIQPLKRNGSRFVPGPIFCFLTPLDVQAEHTNQLFFQALQFQFARVLFAGAVV